MRFQYGGFLHDENECWVESLNREAIRTDRGLVRSLLHTVTFGMRLVTSGASAQADLTSAMLAREVAYSVHRQDFRVLDNDGALTVFYMPDAGSLSGVQVIQPPSYRQVDRANYATVLEAFVTLQAEYPWIEPGAEIIDFQELLTFSGGLPVRVFLQCVNSNPVEQVVSPRSTYDVVQQGFIRTLTPSPAPMAPIWPAALTQRSVTLNSPRIQQHVAGEYATSWVYQYRSVTELTGLPNVL